VEEIKEEALSHEMRERASKTSFILKTYVVWRDNPFSHRVGGQHMFIIQQAMIGEKKVILLLLNVGQY
jgi:hypothetical protein